MPVVRTYRPDQRLGDRRHSGCPARLRRYLRSRLKPVVLSLLALLLSACGGSDETGQVAGDEASDPVPAETQASDPFPAKPQNLLANGLWRAGSPVEFGPDTDRCEAIYLIVRDVASRSDPRPTGPISQENAEAAASANGSLFRSVSNLNRPGESGDFLG